MVHNFQMNKIEKLQSQLVFKFIKQSKAFPLKGQNIFSKLSGTLHGMIIIQK